MTSFSELNLPDSLLQALQQVGYESPSPIQAATIPHLLQGRDVLGQAQTGTGKTASFALPVLARLQLNQRSPQALVLAPTRELAIQVAEAFQTYARFMPGFHVLPIYGGQSYGPQLGALKRGVHIVVGTPGRIIDHLEKGSLDLSQINTLVLDEADEMLRMGFIDDVERILQETPASRQTALFSATMPAPIKRIAQTYLRDPAEVTIAAKTSTAENIRQRYWLVSGLHKLDALTRILEAESFDGMIIFSRTKQGTEELAEKLDARGFSAAAINGDMNQQQRERTIQQLKEGKIDILVATDVAARGLDVERISHVINYDVPYDPESYTHRIGRTGRAGRSGEAILFITPREKNLLRLIERTTRQTVTPLTLPTVQNVNDARINRFRQQILDIIEQDELDQYKSVLEALETEHNVPMLEIAAALARLARGDKPLLLDKKQRDVSSAEIPARPNEARPARLTEPGMRSYRIAVGHKHRVKPGNIVGAIANEIQIEARQIGRIEILDQYSIVDLPDDLSPEALEFLQDVIVAGQALRIRPWTEQPEIPMPRERAPRESAARETTKPARRFDDESPKSKRRDTGPNDFPMQAYRIEVGRAHGVTPSNIVGAIANEAGLESRHIGRIDIHDEYSTLDLPSGMPKDLLAYLKKVWISGRQIQISEIQSEGTPRQAEAAAKPAKEKKGREKLKR